MQHHIERITSSFAEKLPENKVYFEPADLRELSYPEFFVKRVEKELRRNLDDSVIIPETEWADMESPQVHESWDNFLQAIQSVVRMPRSFAHTVFESAVADILELLVQPRKQMVDALFGTKSYLKIDELETHASYITVYAFLPLALIRYMRKREIDEIDRKRAAQIIAMVDEKVTSRYTPLNWAQLIEPWFILMGPELDSELLRQFFQDKELFNLAEHFDEENQLINRTNFIEILSRPDFDISDLENAEQYNKSHPHKHSKTDEKEEEDSRESFSQKNSFVNSGKENIRRFELDNESEADADIPPESEFDISKQDLNQNQYKTEKREASEKISQPEKEQPESHNPKEKEEIIKAPQKSSLEDELEKLSRQSTQKAPASEETISFDDLKNEEDSDSLLDQFGDSSESNDYDELDFGEHQQEEDEIEDVPMWQRFEAEPEEKEEESGFEEKPLIDLTQNNSPEEFDEEEYRRLNAHLDLYEDAFIEEIFGGDQNTYVDIKKELSTCNKWKGEATEIIKDEVFGRNSIDHTTEIALDFVDALQSYFLEKQKRKEK